MVPSAAQCILDVGCSNGTVGAALLRQDDGRIVVGIDNNELYVAEAAEKLSEVVKADLNNLRFTDRFSVNSFDCIIFADILEHLVDPWSSLQNAVAVLKPQGSVVISLPNIRHITSLYAIFAHGYFPRRTRGLFDGTHLRWFTFKDMNSLCQAAGLRVVSVHLHLRIYDSPAGQMNRLVQRWLGRFGNVPFIREFLGYQIVLHAVKDK